MTTAPGELRQQIGEILATIRALEQQGSDRQERVENAENRISAEMQHIKHEMRNWQQVTQGRLELLNNGQGKLGIRLEKLEETVNSVKMPVEELINLRRRLGAIGLLLVSIASVLWAVAVPVWEVLVKFIGDRLLGHGK